MKKEMYNKYIKTQYIEKKLQGANINYHYIENMFVRSRQMEMCLDKDIAMFTKNELIDYYKSYQASSIYLLQTINSNIRSYIDWYSHSINHINENPTSLISVDDLRQCVNKEALHKSIITRDELINLINDLPNFREKVIMLGIFEGIKGNHYIELSHLSLDDVEKKGGKYFVNLVTGRRIEISEQLYLFIVGADREIEKIPLLEGTERPSEFIKLDNYVIKYNYNANVTSNDKRKMEGNVRRCLLRALEYLGLAEYISSKSLMESGKIYTIGQICKENGIEISESCKEFRNAVKQVEEKYNNRIIIKNMLNDYKDILITS